MWARVMCVMAIMGAGGAGAAVAQPMPSGAVLAERAAKRWPQPVRVGDLIGRAVLEPIEAQPVLGHVVALMRRGDGGVDVVMRYGGVLGVGARLIAVPAEAMALLGEHVAVIDLTPAQLDTLPVAIAGAGLGADEKVRLAIVRPFH